MLNELWKIMLRDLPDIDQYTGTSKRGPLMGRLAVSKKRNENYYIIDLNNNIIFINNIPELEDDPGHEIQIALNHWINKFYKRLRSNNQREKTDENNPTIHISKQQEGNRKTT